MRAKEMLLEFQSKDEMLEVLREVESLLLEKFNLVKPCPKHTS